MAKNTSILLGDHFESFVSREISSGRYSTASEVIRTALRLLETEEEKKKELGKALVLGEVNRWSMSARAIVLESKAAFDFL